MKLSLFALTLTIGLAAAAPARAQARVTLVPSMSMSSTYDNNLFATEVGSRDEMVVVTPGIDLQPLTQGADYSYVLDVSGSMQGKLHTLASGVAQALGQMSPNDRFRVVTFNNSAHVAAVRAQAHTRPASKASRVRARTVLI